MEDVRSDWATLRARLHDEASDNPDRSFLYELQDLATRAAVVTPENNTDVAIILQIGLAQLGIDLDEETAGHAALRNGLNCLS